ncbi:MAG: succinyl-diaminopimelate desuccinylase [Gammaproteobacteria bacterium]
MLQLTKLLSDLVACPSITPNDAKCQQILINILQQWKYNITLLPHQETHNFWATPATNPAPRFIYAGHTDVVSVGNINEWRFPPFSLNTDEGLVYGRGVADMKGSITAMMVALEKFRIDFPEQANDIGFLITSAEEGPAEQGTPIVLDYLNEQGIHFDWCLVGEPTCDKRLGDTIKNGRRGSLSGKLLINGKQGHIAYPHLANNPIHLLAPLLYELTNVQWDQGNDYFQPTQMQISNIHAGTGAGNVIPGQLEMLFNFRYSPCVTAIALMQKTEQLLQKFNLSYQLEWTHYGEPFLTTPGTLIDCLTSAIKQVCDITPTLSTTGGTSDARYIAKTGAQVVEFGLCNATIHQINEHVAMHDIPLLSDIYYTLCKNLLVR